MSIWLTGWWQLVLETSSIEYMLGCLIEQNNTRCCMCRQICAIIVCPLYSSCSTFGEQLTLESTRVASQALGLY